MSTWKAGCRFSTWGAMSVGQCSGFWWALCARRRLEQIKSNDWSNVTRVRALDDQEPLADMVGVVGSSVGAWTDGMQLGPVEGVDGFDDPWLGS
jgi:hypothetical protein